MQHNPTLMLKKTGKWLFFSFIIFVCFSRIENATAQSASAEIQPKRIVLGESTYYLLTIKDIQDPTPPVFPKSANYEIEILAPDVRSSSFRQIDFITGKIIKNENHHVVFRFRLTPKHSGQIEIPGFTYNHQQFSQNIAPVLFIVEKEAPGNKFVNVQLRSNLSEVYVGQPFSITITVLAEKKLYPEECAIEADWIVDIPNFSTGYFETPAKYKTFYMDLDTQNSPRRAEVPFEQEVLEENGNNSYQYKFTREYIPMSAGTYEIPPSTLKCAGLFEETRKQYVNLKVIKTSNPLKLLIQDAPEENRPETYSGAMGDFTFEATIERPEIQVGEAWIVQMKIRGVGNIKTMGTPKIPELPDFKYYEPKIEVKEISKKGYEEEALILAEIVPKKPGMYTLPPILFTYFDTKTKTYQTLKSPPFELTAKKSDGKILETFKASEDSEHQKIQAGIQYIQENLSLLKHQTYYFNAWLYWSIYPVSLLIYGLLNLRRKMQHSYSSNEALRARDMAYKKAKTQLSNLGTEPLTQLAEIWITYLSEKLMLPPGLISAKQISEPLHKTKASATLIQEIIQLIQDLEYSRFGGTKGASDLEKRVSDTLNKSEKVL